MYTGERNHYCQCRQLEIVERVLKGGVIEQLKVLLSISGIGLLGVIMYHRFSFNTWTYS